MSYAWAALVDAGTKVINLRALKKVAFQGNRLCTHWPPPLVASPSRSMNASATPTPRDSYQFVCPLTFGLMRQPGQPAGTPAVTPHGTTYETTRQSSRELGRCKTKRALPCNPAHESYPSTLALRPGTQPRAARHDRGVGRRPFDRSRVIKTRARCSSAECCERLSYRAPHRI